MGKLTFRGWYKNVEDAPQPTSPVVTKRDGTKVICLTVDERSDRERLMNKFLLSMVFDVEE